MANPKSRPGAAAQNGRKLIIKPLASKRLPCACYLQACCEASTMR